MLTDFEWGELTCEALSIDALEWGGLCNFCCNQRD